MLVNQTWWELGPEASWWPLAKASSYHSAPPTSCSYRAELISTKYPNCTVGRATNTAPNWLHAPKVAREQFQSLPQLPPWQPDSCNRNQILRKGLNPPSRQLQNWFPKNTDAPNTREKQPKCSHYGSWKNHKVVLGACLVLRGHTCPEKVGLVSLPYKL